MVFGLTFVFINGPFQAPDEGAHFWRAYHVSQGDLFTSRQDDKTVGGQIPESIAHAHVPYDYLIGQPQERVNRDLFYKDLSRPFNSQKTVFTDFFTPALYAPTVYLPQAIGIAVARTLGLSALKMMYAGRISALLCWTAMLYAAIRIVPIFKWVFLVVALQPRTLFQAASLSADGPTNAIAILLTALILRAVFSQERFHSKWVPAAIFLLSVLLALAKQVYLPLVGLVFLIPVRKFDGWKRKLLFCGFVIAAAVLATGLWSLVIRDLYKPHNEANAPKQLELLMHHPWIFFVIAFNSLLETWVGLFVSFIGLLGFLDVWLPKWIYYTYPFALLGTALLDPDCIEPLSWMKRSWVILICIASFLLIELSMYLSWTQPGSDIVVGVHGRYFIPLAIPALLALFYNRPFKLQRRPFLQLTLTLYIVAVLSASCWALWARYYGPVS